MFYSMFVSLWRDSTSRKSAEGVNELVSAPFRVSAALQRVTEVRGQAPTHSTGSSHGRPPLDRSLSLHSSSTKHDGPHRLRRRSSSYRKW